MSAPTNPVSTAAYPHRRAFLYALFLALCFSTPALPASNDRPWAPNPFSVTMLGMLDSMGLLDHYRWYESGYYDGPNGRGNAVGAFDGIWLSRDNQLLGVRDGFARLFDGVNQYQDFRLRLHGDHLMFKSMYSNSVHRFDFRLQGRHLWLRDRYGNLRQFLRMR